MDTKTAIEIVRKFKQKMTKDEDLYEAIETVLRKSEEMFEQEQVKEMYRLKQIDELQKKVEYFRDLSKWYKEANKVWE